MIRSLFLTLFALTFLSAYPANAERRLALVVGVAEYRELPGIVRSVADARAVSHALTEIGFQSDLVLEHRSSSCPKAAVPGQWRREMGDLVRRGPKLLLEPKRLPASLSLACVGRNCGARMRLGTGP